MCDTGIDCPTLSHMHALLHVEIKGINFALLAVSVRKSGPDIGRSQSVVYANKHRWSNGKKWQLVSGLKWV